MATAIERNALELTTFAVLAVVQLILALLWAMWQPVAMLLRNPRLLGCGAAVALGIACPMLVFGLGLVVVFGFVTFPR